MAMDYDGNQIVAAKSRVCHNNICNSLKYFQWKLDQNHVSNPNLRVQ